MQYGTLCDVVKSPENGIGLHGVQGVECSNHSVPTINTKGFQS